MTGGVIVPVPGPASPAETESILLFPHAGGSPRQFAMWPRAITAAIGTVTVLGVTYPGRDRRLRAAHPARIQDLAVEVADAITQMPVPPTVLAGHSLGATVALETLLELHRRNPEGCLPVLFASGQAAPEGTGGGRVHRASDRELLAELRRIDAATAEALADPEQAMLHLPTIREEYRLIETYRHSLPLHTQMKTTIIIIRGNRDTDLSLPAMAGWHRWASRVTGPVIVPGEHMHHLAEPDLAVLCGGVAKAAGRRRAAAFAVSHARTGPMTGRTHK